MVPSADPESYLSSVLIPDQDYSNLVEGKIKFFQFFSKFESDFCVKHYSKLGITFLTFIFLTVSLIVTVFCESKFYQNSKSKILFLVPKPDPGSLAITVENAARAYRVENVSQAAYEFGIAMSQVGNEEIFPDVRCGCILV